MIGITILLLAIVVPVVVGAGVSVVVHGKSWRETIRPSLFMLGMTVATFSSVIGLRQLPSIVGFLFQIPAVVGVILAGRFFRNAYLQHALDEQKQLQAIAARAASETPADRLLGQMELADREENRVRNRRRGVLFTAVTAVAGVILGSWWMAVWGVVGAGLTAIVYRPKKSLPQLPRSEANPDSVRTA